MLFNSIDFAIFLPIVFFVYWFVVNKKTKYQNFFIVVASYIFYGWWDWRFLSLIFLSTITDYFVGLALYKETNEIKRKLLLGISLSVNLGILGFFKYFNFFLDNFSEAFSLLGINLNISGLDIVLPVGISFYTFQTLSYTIDVYRKKITPTNDLIAFMAYVSFFPQLVAGPIERASNLLPQFFRKRTFEYAKSVDGLKQILWGMFKKVVIADNAGQIADSIFGNWSVYHGSTLLCGAIFFAFQIYGDFSGYSDIAIGTAKLFGFNLMQNFKYPYFSRDIAEFWRRWHISLSSWFKDYLYIPLGGSRGSTLKKIRNTFIIFVVSGFWHGANWTFIVWGMLNALYFLPLLLAGKNRLHLDTVAKDRILPSPKEFMQISFTFVLTVFAWIFFRSANISQALGYIGEIFSESLFRFPQFYAQGKVFMEAILIVFFVSVEWIGRNEPYAIAKIGDGWNKLLRWSWYSFIIFLIGLYMQTTETPFIYFQF